MLLLQYEILKHKLIKSYFEMKNITQIIKSFSLFIFLFQFSFQVFAQKNSTPKKTYADVKTLFQKLDDFERIIIQLDIDAMLSNKRSEEYQPATILFYGDNQSTIKFEAKVKARGKYRRVYCDLPPLKVNFSKSELDDLGLYTKFDKFKLVNNCYLSGKADQALLKEFCVYKMYNQISEQSFRVKSFSIIYQDLSLIHI